MNAKTTAVLTTFDRGRLLARTLPRIVGECMEAGVPLVVADDHSTDGC